MRIQHFLKYLFLGIILTLIISIASTSIFAVSSTNEYTVPRGKTVDISIDIGSIDLIVTSGTIQFDFDSNVFEIISAQMHFSDPIQANINKVNKTITFSSNAGVEAMQPISDVTLKVFDGAKLGDYTVKYTVELNVEGDEVISQNGEISVTVECNHSYPDDWTVKDDETHSRRCIYCGNVAVEKHTYDEGVVTKEATHSEEGVILYTCKLCGATKEGSIERTKEHEYGEWKYHNAELHKRTCAYDQTSEYGSHDWKFVDYKEPTDEGFGEETYICTICGATKTVKEHRYSQWEKYNSTSHQRQCEDCGKVLIADHEFVYESTIKVPTHTETGLDVYVCTVCGYKKSVVTDVNLEHVYGAWEQYDERQHIRKCIFCDVTEKEFHNLVGTDQKLSTHFEEGYIVWTCSDCSYVRTDTFPKLEEHVYGDWYYLDEEYHQRTCLAGDDIQKSVHNYDSGTVTRATCTSKGKITFRCVDCGHTYEVELEIDPNYHYDSNENPCATELIGKIDPTCTEDGFSGDVKCLSCKQIIEKGHVVNKLGHNLTEVVNEKYLASEANCIEISKYYYVCSRCGFVSDQTFEYGEIAPNVHKNTVIVSEVKATCTTSGYTSGVFCNDCKQYLSGHEFVEALGHKWDAGVTTKYPTHTSIGEKLFTCTVCGLTKTEMVPAAQEHSFGDWFSFNEESHKRICIYGDEEVELHTWVFSQTVVEATCGEEGQDEYVCPVCNAKKIEYLPKLTEHTYDFECDDTCNVCGEKREVVHTPDEEWHFDETSHFHICEVCSSRVDIEDHVPGEEATDERAQYCLVCNYKMSDPLPHTQHRYSETWQYDSQNHWVVCIVCGAIDRIEEHTFSEGIVTKEPTTEEEGVKTYRCVCGYEKTESIDKLPIMVEGETFWTPEKTGLTIKFNVDIDEFLSCAVDGKGVNGKYYDVKEGSTILTFHNDYLNSLGNGKHLVTFYYTGGTIETEFSVDGVREPMKISDLTPLFIIGGIALLVTAGVIVAIVLRNKRISEEEYYN